MIKAFISELKVVQDIYFGMNENPPLSSNMPFYSGRVSWSRGLRTRIHGSMEKIKLVLSTCLFADTQLPLQVLQSDDFRDASRLYELIVAQLVGFEEKNISEWSQEVENVSQEKLKQNLLGRSQQQFLAVNFDPALVAMLREVKYFVQDGVQVPDAAVQLFKKAEMFRQQIGNLDLIVQTYNRILLTLLDVERPLFQTKMEALDAIVVKGITQLTWKSHGISEFIQQVTATAKESFGILQVIKGNMSLVEKTLKVWEDNLMIERRAGKTYTADEFQSVHELLVRQRYDDVKAGSDGIQSLLLGSLKAVKASKGSPAWRNYIDFVSTVVRHHLSESVIASAAFLSNQIDANYIASHDVTALIEVKLELLGSDIVFVPDIGYNSNNSVGVAEGWVRDFVNVATFMQRVDGSEGDLLFDVQEDLNVKFSCNAIKGHLQRNREDCEEFRRSYNKYSFLWNDDIAGAFLHFISSQSVSDVNLDAFDERIRFYRSLEDEIKELTATKTIGWLKIDAKPLKQALFTWVSKWLFAFNQYLLRYLESEVSEVCEFIDTASQRLDTVVTDIPTLLPVLETCRSIKLRAETFESKTTHLNAVVSLIAKYGTSPMDSTVVSLENLPAHWTSLRKKAVSIKEKYAAFQQQGAEELRGLIKGLEDRAFEFSKKFLIVAPFDSSEISCDEAYRMIDKLFFRGGAFEEGSDSLNDLEVDVERLFYLSQIYDISYGDFRDIRSCRQQLVSLKQMWDIVALGQDTMSQWRLKDWESLSLGVLQQVIEGVKDTFDTLDRNSRRWGALCKLNDALDRVSSVMPMLDRLRTDFVRDRHWKQIMRVASVSINVNAKLSLGDILNLNLHEHFAEVYDILDRAEKELVVEKKLKHIEEEWDVLEVTFTATPDGSAFFIVIPQTVRECIADHNVILTTIADTPVVLANSNFLEEVTKWQRRLGVMDELFGLWLGVQSRWQCLYTIFVGSSDVKNRLPDDSRRFDMVSQQWKSFMREASFITNALETSSSESRREKLEEVERVLEKCENALDGYLETKRRQFPRLNFLSTSDLVEMLSKASTPQLIVNSILRCFENLIKLDFTSGKDGAFRIVTAVHSSDGDVLSLAAPLLLEGSVESYMGDLLRTMQQSIRKAIFNAFDSREEKERSDWLHDNCGQAAVVTEHLAFSLDLSAALDDCESGSDQPLRDLVKNIDDDVQKLVVAVSSDEAAAKIVAVMTTRLHQRGVLEYLLSKRYFSEGANFEWAGLPKLRVGDNSEITVSIFNLAYAYGCEFFGTRILTECPFSDGSMIAISTAFHSKFVSMVMPQATPASSFAAAAHFSGFSCISVQPVSNMDPILKAIAGSGCWIEMQLTVPFDLEIICLVASSFVEIFAALQIGGRELILRGSEVSLSNSAHLALVCNPHILSSHLDLRIPSDLRSIIRPAIVGSPSMEVMIEILLSSVGVIGAKSLSRRISYAITAVNNMIRAIGTRLLSFEFVKSALSRFDANGVESSNVAAVVTSHLRRYLSSQLDGADLALATTIVETTLLQSSEAASNFVGAVSEHPSAALTKVLSSFASFDDSFESKCSVTLEVISSNRVVYIVGPTGTGKSSLVTACSRVWLSSGSGPKDAVCVSPSAIFSPHQSHDQQLSSLVHLLDDNLHSHGDHVVVWFDGTLAIDWAMKMTSAFRGGVGLTLSGERRVLPSLLRFIVECEHIHDAPPNLLSTVGFVAMGNDATPLSIVMSAVDGLGVSLQLASKLRVVVQKQFTALLSEVAASVPGYNLRVVASSFNSLLSGLLKVALPRASEDVTEDFVRALESMVGYVSFGVGCVPFIHAFDSWVRKWTESNRAMKLPDGCTIADVAFDPSGLRWVPLSESTSTYVVPFTDTPAGAVLVPTPHTIRSSCILDILLSDPRLPAINVIAPRASGKTLLALERLRLLDPEATVFSVVCTNSAIWAHQFFTAIAAKLEKKSSRVMAPPLSKRLTLVIDDLSAGPSLGEAEVSQVGFIRFLKERKAWFDGSHGLSIEIQNTTTLSISTPAPSQDYNFRLLRPQALVALIPTLDLLPSILVTLIRHHSSFPDSAPFVKAPFKVAAASADVVNMTVERFQAAIDFRSHFSPVRVAIQIVCDVCSASSQVCDLGVLVKLWAFTTHRLVSCRFPSVEERRRCADVIREVARRYFEDVPVDSIISCNVWSPHVDSEGIVKLVHSCGLEEWRGTLGRRLRERNDVGEQIVVPPTDVVADSVTAAVAALISRVGHLFLTGDVGVGKHTIASISAELLGLDAHELPTSSASCSAEMVVSELMASFIKVGCQGVPIVLIVRLDELTNDAVAALAQFVNGSDFAQVLCGDDIELIVSAVRDEVKRAGLIETKDSCIDFFFSKVRQHLHVIFCSTIASSYNNERGTLLRSCQRACVTLALSDLEGDAFTSSASQILSESDILRPYVDAVSSHCAFAAELLRSKATKTGALSSFPLVCNRSFTDGLKLVVDKCATNTTFLSNRINHIEKALQQLSAIESSQSELKRQLDEETQTHERLRAVVEDTRTRIGQLRTEGEDVLVRLQDVINTAALLKVQSDSLQDLVNKESADADPLWRDAENCLNKIDKKALVDLKAVSNPPAEIQDVIVAALILRFGAKEGSWAAAKKLFAAPEKLLKDLRMFDRSPSSEPNVDLVESTYASKDSFSPQVLRMRNATVAEMAGWVLLTCRAFRSMSRCFPTRAKLLECNKKSEDLSAHKSMLQERKCVIEESVVSLTAAFMAETEAKGDSERKLEVLSTLLATSERLTVLLESEREVWKDELRALKERLHRVVGDSILEAQCVNWFGVMSTSEQPLILAEWRNDLKDREILFSSHVSPLAKTDARLHHLKACLPDDPAYLQAATIVAESPRTPLLLDDTLIAVEWLRRQSSSVRLHASASNFSFSFEACVQNGLAVVVDLLDDIPPLLNTFLTRRWVRRGRATVFKLDDREVEIDPAFRLYLRLPTAVGLSRRAFVWANPVRFSASLDVLHDLVILKLAQGSDPVAFNAFSSSVADKVLNEIKVVQAGDAILSALASAEAACVLDDPVLVERIENDFYDAAARAEEIRLLALSAAPFGAMKSALRPEAVKIVAAVEAFCEMRLSLGQRVEVGAAINLIEPCMASLVDKAEVFPSFVQLLSSSLPASSRTAFICLVKLLHAVASSEISAQMLNFILSASSSPTPPIPNPVQDVLSDNVWASLSELSAFAPFEPLQQDVEAAPKRFRDAFDGDFPDDAALPGDFRKLSDLLRCFMFKAFRPDRLIHVLQAVAVKFVGRTPSEMSSREAIVNTLALTPMAIIRSRDALVADDAVRRLSFRLGPSWPLQWVDAANSSLDIVIQEKIGLVVLFNLRSCVDTVLARILALRETLLARIGEGVVRFILVDNSCDQSLRALEGTFVSINVDASDSFEAALALRLRLVEETLAQPHLCHDLRTFLIGALAVHAFSCHDVRVLKLLSFPHRFHPLEALARTLKPWLQGRSVLLHEWRNSPWMRCPVSPLSLFSFISHNLSSSLNPLLPPRRYPLLSSPLMRQAVFSPDVLEQSLFNEALAAPNAPNKFILFARQLEQEPPPASLNLFGHVVRTRSRQDSSIASLLEANARALPNVVPLRSVEELAGEAIVELLVDIPTFVA